MKLDSVQVHKAHNFFKRLLSIDPEYLKKKGVERCKRCDGTGLAGVVRLAKGGSSWDTSSFCNKCWGVGFTGIRHLNTFDDKKFICGTCQGVGCDECNRTGFVDWITHAMGR